MQVKIALLLRCFLLKTAFAYDEEKKYDKAIKFYKRILKDYFQSDEARDMNKYIAYDENMMKK